MKPGSEAPGESPALPASRWSWLPLGIAMVLIGLYFSGRFDGHWAENDSAVLTEAIRALTREGRLIPTEGAVYRSGYAYQAMSAFILALTGLDVVTLQQLVYPVLAALIVLPAWALYRELTESDRGATLATALLLTQPEFLFIILRSSHEKFTRALMLLGLFWLARSFKLQDQPVSLLITIGMFYLTAFALIATNGLLAYSFIFAVLVALLLGWCLAWCDSTFRSQAVPIIRRLPYALTTCLGVAYIFTFYLYPSSDYTMTVMHDSWQHLASLLFDRQMRAVNAYASIADGWIDFRIYLLISAANWVMLFVSFGVWSFQGWKWLRHRDRPRTPASLFLWLLYGAFVFQGMLSMVIDASGALASNLQHRVFPSFSIIAVALIGAALAEWRPRRRVRSLQFGLACGIFCLTILSVLKATNEPLLSNWWMFYRPTELVAVRWSDTHLTNASIWLDFDPRLPTAFSLTNGRSANQNTFHAYQMGSATRGILVTDVTRTRSARLGRPLPVLPDALRVYDNGSAQFYHVRPVTRYQR